jgi:hypothetical protein
MCASIVIGARRHIEKPCHEAVLPFAQSSHPPNISVGSSTIAISYHVRDASYNRSFPLL